MQSRRPLQHCRGADLLRPDGIRNPSRAQQVCAPTSFLQPHRRQFACELPAIDVVRVNGSELVRDAGSDLLAVLLGDSQSKSLKAAVALAESHPGETRTNLR